MAIDTQAKRGAALGFGASVPSLALPFPDGTVNDDDRWVLLGLYPFEAATGVALGILGRFLRLGRRRSGT